MKKPASILFIMFILNASFISCKTQRILSVNEASEISNATNSLLLHTPSKTFKLYDYTFSDSMLVGELMTKTRIKGDVINVYTKQDFYLEFNGKTAYSCELSLSKIEKITCSNISTNKTIVFLAGILVATVLTMGWTNNFGAGYFTMSGGI